MGQEVCKFAVGPYNYSISTLFITLMMSHIFHYVLQGTIQVSSIYIRKM